MLQPKRRKYRKTFRGKNTGLAQKGSTLAFGEFGLKALERAWVTDRQIEAARKKITFSTKRAGKYWIRVFPHKPITGKPVGVKMGSGKGDIKGYVAVVKPGEILFELSGVTPELAKDAFHKAAAKLPIKTVMISK